MSEVDEVVAEAVGDGSYTQVTGWTVAHYFLCLVLTLSDLFFAFVRSKPTKSCVESKPEQQETLISGKQAQTPLPWRIQVEVPRVLVGREREAVEEGLTAAAAILVVSV